MFCFAKQELLITSDSATYPVSVFYKKLHPNFAIAKLYIPIRYTQFKKYFL